MTLEKVMSSLRSIPTARPIVKICMECSSILSDSELCPTCGSEFASFETGTSRSRRWVPIEATDKEEKRRFYAEQVQIARSRGYRLSWAFWRYRDRFNEDPPRELRVA